MLGRRKPEVLALIPARSGSKSVPGKNIVSLAGKPLIAWTIEVAKASRRINRVIVSTDDEQIAAIARQYGAEVPFLRPALLAGDRSRDLGFHLHALEWLKQNEAYSPDMVVNLRPTTPYRDPGVIDQAIEAFEHNASADSLRSVHLACESPFKMWTIEPGGYMNPVTSVASDSEPYNAPRQELPLVYWQDGYIDITRPHVILEKRSTTGDRIMPFMIEEPQVDIDYLEDLVRAEQLGTEPIVVEKSSATVIRYPS